APRTAAGATARTSAAATGGLTVRRGGPATTLAVVAATAAATRATTTTATGPTTTATVATAAALTLTTGLLRCGQLQTAGDERALAGGQLHEHGVLGVRLGDGRPDAGGAGQRADVADLV